MEDLQYGRAYGGPMADDFATYALPESPSSLNSSFGQDNTLFMHGLPPKPSPWLRNTGVNSVHRAGMYSSEDRNSPGKQWPPHGFKAPTLQTAEPEEHWDSTSPETDWLSPASRSSNVDDCATPPTVRWGGRSTGEGVARQWQNSPKTSPRGDRISPRTKKLQMQSAEAYGEARGHEFGGHEGMRGHEGRGNPLARVEEGYVLNAQRGSEGYGVNAQRVSEGHGMDAEMELQSKWQRFQEEEQRKKMRAQEQGRQTGAQEYGESAWQRAEFRRYERPYGRTPAGHGSETEEQRQEEEFRQERWRQLKHGEAERQRDIDGQSSAMIGPAPTLAEWKEPQTAPQLPTMVRQKCWARGEGDVLVKQDCWVEEEAPGVSNQGPSHPPPQSTPHHPHPPVQLSFDRWQAEEPERPGSSGREHFTRERYSERPPRGQGWDNQGGGQGNQERVYTEGQRYQRPDRLYDSDALSGRASGSVRWQGSMAVATFPRSAKERAEWESQGGGWDGAERAAQRGSAEAAEGGGSAKIAEVEGRGFERELRTSIEQRWTEQTGRELQSVEGGSNQVGLMPPGTVASIEQRVSEVGYVAEDEKIWVQEQRTSSKALVPPVEKVSRGESSPTLVAEAVSRLALTQVGWDEAMHNFHDLRGVKAVVKRPEELLSPASVTGAVTLSGLARKRAVSLPLGGGEMGVVDNQVKIIEESPVAEQPNATRHVRANSDVGEVRESAKALPAGGVLPAVANLPAGVNGLPALGERPLSSQGQMRPGSRPGSARERGAWSDADVSSDVTRRSAPRPRHSGGRSLPLSVAAIVFPPFARNQNQEPPASLARSDTYPPSERTPPSDRVSPVWSTAITSAPLLAQPPLRARAGEFRPTVTHPPALPPLPLLQDWEARAQGLVPHPPTSPSPTSRLHRRTSSRSGVTPVDERRVPPPEVALVQYDSEPTPRRSIRGLSFAEGGCGNESDGYDEALGARRREDLTPRPEDGSQSARSRFAPTPRRGGAGQVSFADGIGPGEERPQVVVEVDCPICNEPLQVGRAMFAPECGHFVHFDCCRSNLLQGSLDCMRCHQRMLEKPYLKTPYRPSDS